MRAATLIALSIVLGSTGYGYAQMTHSEHADAMDHGIDTQAPPSIEARLSEPGQDAFAALSEVVAVLVADPATDWTRVDIRGLRDHLVDMDRLVTGTQVEEAMLANGIQAFATGDAETLATLLRMVPAHATELARDGRWTVVAQEDDEGITLTVTSVDPAVIAQIQGMGFFGLMASQDHHREHHFAIASGEVPHGH